MQEVQDNMPTFEFKEAEHIYLLDGVIIPGTTKVLAYHGIINYEWLDEWYREKGNALHLATELWDREILDEETVDSQIQGRFDAWKKFRQDTGFEILGIEIPMYHPIYHYGVKPDRWGFLNGKLTLVEIKPATVEKWHILQRAANRAALIASGIAIQDDINIYLSDNGTYKLSSKSSGRHEANEFFTLISAMKIKEKYKGGLL